MGALDDLLKLLLIYKVHLEQILPGFFSLMSQDVSRFYHLDEVVDSGFSGLETKGENGDKTKKRWCFKLGSSEILGGLSPPISLMTLHPGYLFVCLFVCLSWQWNIPIFNRKYIFKGSIFHCYVRLPSWIFSESISVPQAIPILVHMSLTVKWSETERSTPQPKTTFQTNLSHYVLPRKLKCPLKREYFSRECIFQPLIFRGHSLVFRGVLYRSLFF